jgi:hypothetical protein
MKKISLFLPLLSFFLSCSPKNIVGNDTVNRCKISAGYQWSQLENKCIRPFEATIKLNPVNDSSYAAFLVEKEGKIEVFAVEVSGSVILNRQNTGVWKNGIWVVENNNGKYLLKKEGKTLYQN